MFRPATPLSVVVGVAFILLLIPVLSVPILKGIKLATYQGVDFGVFGYCKGKRCSQFSVGYTAGRWIFYAAPLQMSRPTARHCCPELLSALCRWSEFCSDDALHQWNEQCGMGEC
jgi:hypothetical protein